MNEVLTLDEMKSRYDGEWVLVEDPEVDQHLQVIQGRVIAHGLDRDAVDRQAHELRPQHAASLCFQKIPEGMVYVL